MKIFIDESGLFSQLNDDDKVKNGWATIGALVVPEKSEQELEKALEELKKSLGLTKDQEIKRGRPDCSNPSFADFVNKIKKLQCTLYAMVINRQTINDSVAIQYKEELMDALNNYCIVMRKYNDDDKQAELQKEVKSQCEMISSLSNAEFIQMKTQCYLHTFMLSNIIIFYAKHAPEELKKITFISDKKNPSFENVFKKQFPQYVEAELTREPKSLIHSEKLNYDFFFDSYGLNRDEEGMDEDNNRRINIFGVDYSTFKDGGMARYNILKIFDDMRFEDSKQSAGLQVIDLLASNINRTLKGHCDDLDIQASILGELTVNTPDENIPNIPVLIFENSLLEKAEIKFDALVKMSKH